MKMLIRQSKRSSMVILLAILAVIAAVIVVYLWRGRLAATNTSPTTQTYKSETGDFRLQYPAEWHTKHHNTVLTGTLQLADFGPTNEAEAIEVGEYESHMSPEADITRLATDDIAQLSSKWITLNGEKAYYSEVQQRGFGYTRSYCLWHTSVRVCIAEHSNSRSFLYSQELSDIARSVRFSDVSR
jgi:hypothetical protein